MWCQPQLRTERVADLELLAAFPGVVVDADVPAGVVADRESLLGRGRREQCGGSDEGHGCSCQQCVTGSHLARK